MLHAILVQFFFKEFLILLPLFLHKLFDVFVLVRTGFYVGGINNTRPRDLQIRDGKPPREYG